MESVNYIHAIDCLTGLKNLPEESIQCCVSSPPYYRLRDYGVDSQVGMEATPEGYVQRLVEIFTEVRRVLKSDGVLWLNLGDSYWHGKPAAQQATGPVSKDSYQLKQKDLIGIPWATAFALRDSGWHLRQDIIWAKRNCMPESVRDRCTRSHEYIFMLTKSPQYFYNGEAIKTTRSESSIRRDERGKGESNKYAKGIPGTGDQAIHQPKAPLKQDGHGIRHAGFNERWRQSIKEQGEPLKANRRSVWTLRAANFKGAHFATFPLELPQLCIQATTREGDIVLDPFAGAGTTPLAAALLNRKYIGFELNPLYVEIAKARLKQSLGLFYPDSNL
ncbi:DNA-methyltransferase [Chitinophaga tropicalis]|uniref:Methyltransferase n=1 Tax=Chitinophaga tropicalis TaxID=2683588 RepID=A0A7K1U002_9BACT|nr:site-specific DNA-methyltransferase [Chitinophaga tropicalis]MVT07682.1 site-specific DNA-methyltransferase [Chitinophaga tropicalis]